MGLNDRNLKRFSNKRLYSTIIFENLPQLLIQFYFQFRESGSNVNTMFDDIDLFALFAFISSIVSILVTIIDVWLSSSLLKMYNVVSDYAENELELHFIKGKVGATYFMSIKSGDLEEKKKLLIHRPNATKKLLGEILEINSRCIEMNMLFPIFEGIRIGFTIYPNHDRSPHEMFNDLKRCDKVGQLFQKQWKLTAIPSIEDVCILINGQETNTMDMVNGVKNVNVNMNAQNGLSGFASLQTGSEQAEQGSNDGDGGNGGNVLMQPLRRDTAPVSEMVPMIQHTKGLNMNEGDVGEADMGVDNAKPAADAIGIGGGYVENNKGTSDADLLQMDDVSLSDDNENQHNVDENDGNVTGGAGRGGYALPDAQGYVATSNVSAVLPVPALPAQIATPGSDGNVNHTGSTDGLRLTRIETSSAGDDYDL